MTNPDYNIALTCLRENLALLADSYGKVPPENVAAFNISNALLVVCDALQVIQSQLMLRQFVVLRDPPSLDSSLSIWIRLDQLGGYAYSCAEPMPRIAYE
jgi:hypothetical protein